MDRNIKKTYLSGTGRTKSDREGLAGCRVEKGRRRPIHLDLREPLCLSIFQRPIKKGTKPTDCLRRERQTVRVQLKIFENYLRVDGDILDLVSLVDDAGTKGGNRILKRPRLFIELVIYLQELQELA